MITVDSTKIPSIRSINPEILLRNRDLFRNYRDVTFKKALSVLYDVLNRFAGKKLENSELDELSKKISEMVDYLEDARFYARMSVGGNNIAPPPSVSQQERTWVDHVETTYSLARSIRRFIRHDIQLAEYAAISPELNGKMSDYLDVIRQNDVDLILGSLNAIKERIETFSGFIGNDL